MTTEWKNAGNVPVDEEQARAAIEAMKPGEVLLYEEGDSRVECHGGSAGYGISYWNIEEGEWEPSDIGKTIESVMGDLETDHWIAQDDVEARVYLATRYSRIPDVREDLELEDRVILGVYGSEESAQQAIAEAAAEEWEEAISDLDLTDEDEEKEAFAFMEEHRWEVEPQTVLS